MKMKQIQAANIREAMLLARAELGDDAVMINDKKAAGGGVIVTFAIEEFEEPIINDLPETDFGMVLPFAPEIPKPATAKTEVIHPALALIGEALDYHGVPEFLRDRLSLHVSSMRLTPDHVLDTAEQALASALTTHLSFQPIATAGTPPTRAMMLIGPHGAGKTSTLAKIATELTLHKQPVVLVSTDTERMGAADTLHTLAGLLKCEAIVSDKRAHLKEVVTRLQGKAWVLIDSTGANIYEFKQLKALGELASLQGIEPILTCAAGMDSAEAQEMAAIFNFLNIDRMLITRLDATRRLRSVFAALTTGGYALSNFTSSALPTEACQPLSAAALARLMLRQARERMTH